MPLPTLRNPLEGRTEDTPTGPALDTPSIGYEIWRTRNGQTQQLWAHISPMSEETARTFYHRHLAEERARATAEHRKPRYDAIQVIEATTTRKVVRL